MPDVAAWSYLETSRTPDPAHRGGPLLRKPGAGRPGTIPHPPPKETHARHHRPRAADPALHMDAGLSRHWATRQVDAVIAEDRATQAAEVRAAALDQAADWLVRRYGVTNRAAGELRRMAAAARPDDTRGA